MVWGLTLWSTLSRTRPILERICDDILSLLNCSLGGVAGGTNRTNELDGENCQCFVYISRAFVSSDHLYS